ncbi:MULTISPECIES: hypothetical protein [unclassified Microbulbifer]|uniref:hypothetical protein n=1 Tax=unclassified Microbulbifer TaxID=2619833 RepID=UPI0027E52CCD|nr:MULTISPECIES: hypothetical protein [unclassified Microbulbifer]
MKHHCSYDVPSDTEEAGWIATGLGRFEEHAVTSIVPAGFPAYVRVFHPAYIGRGNKKQVVRWAQIVAANGQQASPQMQLCSLTGNYKQNYRDQPGVFDEPPEVGTLPPDLAADLVNVLSQHTSTATECWFGFWEGFGGLPRWVQQAPIFAVPQRRYHLLFGPATAAGESIDPMWWQTPNLWWPQDRSWCVATEIDLNTTYIGASSDCVAALLSTPELEAGRVSPTDGIDYASDPYNAPAPHP